MLTIENLTKMFVERRRSAERALAVNDVSLQVKEGELFTLLGPSGCGKTTTLRSIAGLETPDEGRVVSDGETLFSSSDRINVPANRRGIGMVFQSYAIWPHMTVFDNVAFPLVVEPRRYRRPKREIATAVDRILSVVQLGELAGRPATDLSGGQQQRLALARALVVEPPLLLLDEPLSNLDAKLRESMRFELKRLQSDLGITTVYVTHDQVEALALSDRIAVMNNGGVEQVAPPQEIYRSPMSKFVADFIGNSTFLVGRVLREVTKGEYLIETDGGELLVRPPVGRLEPNSEVILAARPEDLVMHPNRDGSVDAGQPGLWSGKVLEQIYMGDSVDHQVQVGDVELLVRSTPSASMPPDSQVILTLSPDSVSLIPRDSEVIVN